MAERAGWIVAQVEAGQTSSLREAIGEALHAPLAALYALAHVAGQRGWRFLLALAGLPSLPRVLTEAKSYAERPTTRWSSAWTTTPRVGRCSTRRGRPGRHGRWERATRSEQRYLRAMAQDGDDGGLAGALAERLGKRPGCLGPARAALIAKGLIYPREHGVVAFTVPGIAGFVLRQPQG